MKKSLKYLAITGVTMVALVILFFIGVIVNRAKADPSTDRRENTVVVEVRHEKKKATRRVRNRVYATGQEYDVFSAEVIRDDGRKMSIPIDALKYNRLHVGDTVSIVMRRGYFGYPVLIHDSTRFFVKRPKHRRPRYQRSAQTICRELRHQS